MDWPKREVDAEREELIALLMQKVEACNVHYSDDLHDIMPSLCALGIGSSEGDSELMQGMVGCMGG